MFIVVKNWGSPKNRLIIFVCAFSWAFLRNPLKLHIEKLELAWSQIHSDFAAGFVHIVSPTVADPFYLLPFCPPLIHIGVEIISFYCVLWDYY